EVDRRAAEMGAAGCAADRLVDGRRPVARGHGDRMVVEQMADMLHRLGQPLQVGERSRVRCVVELTPRRLLRVGQLLEREVLGERGHQGGATNCPVTGTFSSSGGVAGVARGPAGGVTTLQMRSAMSVALVQFGWALSRASS